MQQRGNNRTIYWPHQQGELRTAAKETIMDYNEFFNEWREQSLKAFQQMAPATVTPETFVQGMTASADFFLAGQRKMREAVAQSLEASEVPTPKDFARLGNQVRLAEERASECEARLAEANAANDRLEALVEKAVAELHATTAAIDAVEKRLEAVARS
jgi:septal ring factor EnvC (AmiA/AmiB activator)